MAPPSAQAVGPPSSGESAQARSGAASQPRRRRECAPAGSCERGSPSASATRLPGTSAVPAARARNRVTTRTRCRTNSSTSASRVFQPKLTRSVASARASSCPSARKTAEGSRPTLLQAAPLATAKGSIASSRLSPSTPSKVKLTMAAERVPWAAFCCQPGRPAKPASNRFSNTAWRAVAAARSVFAATAAAANAAARAADGVPGRSPPSCPPPKVSGCSTGRGERRTYSAPTPTGPPHLCADKLSKSTSSAVTSTGTLPSACAASVCSKTPRARQTAAMPAMSCTPPVSLFTSMSDTSTVSSRKAAATIAGVTRPSGPGRRTSTPKPSRSSCAQASSTARCSVLAVRTRPLVGRLLATAARTAPSTARLSASVALAVNTSDSGTAPMQPASAARAAASASAARRPGTCARAVGLPATTVPASVWVPSSCSSSAARASGRKGLVAAWSKYGRAKGAVVLPMAASTVVRKPRSRFTSCWSGTARCRSRRTRREICSGLPCISKPARCITRSKWS